MAVVSIQDITASNIMKGPIITVAVDITVKKLQKEFEENEYIAALVKGEEIGLILREKILSLVKNQCDMAVSEIMIKNVLPVQATAALEDIISLIDVLGENGILLVEDEQGPKGIIVLKDIVPVLWDKIKVTEGVLKAVLETVNEAITIIDNNDNVIGWNYKAQSLYNIKSSEILGKKIKSFFTNLVVTEARQSLKRYKDAYHQPCHDTHVLINAKPIRVADGLVGSVSSERDITETVYLHRELTKASSQVRKLEKAMSKIGENQNPFSKIIGKSKKLQNAISMAKRVAITNASVLIRGESGTGKELFAEAIHQESNRKDKPFVVINCGAIPATLFESELFGYSGGAFTGADKKGKPGKFELAHNGTIFLDEIGEMQPDMQVKLLRVLQNKIFYRVGGREPVHIDVRVIAATNRVLEEMIAEGLFRKDLYYRLNVVSLDIASLRERREDIADMVSIFVKEFCSLYSKESLDISSDIMTILLNYSWPGNVRELRNVVERLVILADDGIVKREHLPEEIKDHKIIQKNDFASSLIEETERTERQMILKRLEDFQGNKSKTAEALGIPRSTLYYKLKMLKIKT